jgi:hypothetical protein
MVKAATVALLAAVLGLGPAASAAPQPAVTGSGAERASGLWVYKPDGDEGVRPFAFAEVFVPTKQDGPGIAIVGQGACFRLAAGTPDEQETCRGYGIGHRLAPGEFQLSPLLESAVGDGDVYGMALRQATEPHASLSRVAGAGLMAEGTTSLTRAGDGRYVYSLHRPAGRR